MKKSIQKTIKQIFNFLLALLFLIILSPLFLVITILIKLDSKGPVFFKQERIGKNSRPFIIWKFRSMIEGAEKISILISKNDERITKIGRFLRQWGLDELPELINVLGGKMSLVGPRPTLKYQVDKYNKFQKQRLLVKPGITGWAQIHGRNILLWEDRIKYDVWYVKNWSLWLDFKILFKTIGVVLSKKGVYGKGEINDPFV